MYCCIQEGKISLVSGIMILRKYRWILLDSLASIRTDYRQLRGSFLWHGEALSLAVGGCLVLFTYFASYNTLYEVLHFVQQSIYACVTFFSWPLPFFTGAAAAAAPTECLVGDTPSTTAVQSNKQHT